MRRQHAEGICGDGARLHQALAIHLKVLDNERARTLNYFPQVAATMIAPTMPPQLRLLALQKSASDVKRVAARRHNPLAAITTQPAAWVWSRKKSGI